MIAGDEQELDAVVFILLADAELAEQIDADVFERLAVERVESDERHLRAGGVFDRSAKGLDGSAALGIDDSGEIADVTLGLEGFEVEGAGQASEAEKQQGRTEEARDQRYAGYHFHRYFPRAGR